ncbi:MAG TPA: DMT family transporter [Terriglobia bacterium]|nr:DMT family transporter [Terriglobia bacterium]
MHFPLWLFFALLALLFWGMNGITQKLATNAISTEHTFLWFSYAMFAVALVILAFGHLDWHVRARIFWLGVISGALNGLGVVATMAAFRRGGKASTVVPLTCLYPLVTIFTALTFLHESVTRVQVIGIVLAISAAVLLSQEGKPVDVEKQ